MKVWTEEEILVELVRARMAEAAELRHREQQQKENSHNSTNNNPQQPETNKKQRRMRFHNKRQKRSSSNNNLPTYTDERTRLPFLLVLVRRIQTKSYEFLYHPAETYERIDEIFQLTPIEEASTTASSEEEGTSTEENDDTEAFVPTFVGKAIFHTASGEVLLKSEGSVGWKEALQQKYDGLDARSKAQVQLLTTSQRGRNHTTAKAVASAAIGSYAATSMMATGVAATEATAAAGAGGLTTLQTIGTVGVMASPVGALAAAGAIGGLGTYYFIHRRNKAKKKKQIEQEKEKMMHLEALAQELAALEQDDDDDKSKSKNEYQRLSEDDDGDSDDTSKEDDSPVQPDARCWVVVSAKRIEMEESEHCLDFEAFDDRVEADQSFMEVTSNTAAKALFDPQGALKRVDCDVDDRDGWETALSLHYQSLKEQNQIPSTSKSSKSLHHKHHVTEDTPLLREEAQGEVS